MRASLAASLLAAAFFASAATGHAAGTAAAAHNGGIVGLAAMTGTVFQEGQSSFSGIAVRMRIRGAAFRPSLELMPTMEYWQNTSRLDAFGISTRRSDATLGADLRWVFAGKTWQPYAGAGLSLHFLDDELRSSRADIPSASNGVVRGGIDALAGAEFGLGSRIGSFLELKYLDVSHYRQVKFNTGLGWNF